MTGSPFFKVWGTDIYSDDSSLSTAAVHAGFLKDGETKTLTIRILPGQTDYVGSTQNGVTSASYHQWHGSFTIVNATQ